MQYNYIKNGDCLEGMKELDAKSVNIVLTSPPYNTGRNSGDIKNHEVRYDMYQEDRDNDEYVDWTVDLFNEFDRILSTNGVVLYNMSYGNENAEVMWLTVAAVMQRTNFTIADTIIWKKKSALPNNVSPNRLTRICEFVFVFCRKNESTTFNMNKKVLSYSKTGQSYYENLFNFIDADNNDGSCDLNKATFSSEFVQKLLTLYSTSNEDVVLDPFTGTGTTPYTCRKLGKRYIGFELSPKQYEYALNRIAGCSTIKQEDSVYQKSTIFDGLFD